MTAEQLVWCVIGLIVVSAIITTALALYSLSRDDPGKHRKP